MVVFCIYIAFFAKLLYICKQIKNIRPTVFFSPCNRKRGYIFVWPKYKLRCLFYAFSTFLVIEYIINGHILDSPAGCPEEIGKVMMGCWKRMPNERRPMKSIKSILEKLYTDRIDNCNVTEGAEITWIPESVRDSGNGTTFPLNDHELRPNGVFI